MKHDVPKPTVSVTSTPPCVLRAEIAMMEEILELQRRHDELTQMLGERGITAPQASTTMGVIAAWVGGRHGVTVDEIRGESRLRHIVRARQEVMWTLYERRRPNGSHAWSLPAIGRFLGRDHTTVLYGVRQHQARIDAGEVQS